MGKIDRFVGRYRFLSNFWITPIVFGVDIYKSVEHAYQAAKTNILSERERIQAAPTPGDAKCMGRTITLRPDWEHVKLEVMYKLVKQKFSADPLRAQLLATGDAELIEGNNWHDNFWGACACLRCVDLVKDNQLGAILEGVREEIKNVSINA